MDNPIINTLVLTVVGMAVVFVAMSFFYVSMRVLTAATQEKEASQKGPQNDEETPAATSPSDPRRELQAAAIVVALARADSATPLPADLYADDLQTTSWGAYYRQRQLRPGGRGRIA